MGPHTCMANSKRDAARAGSLIRQDEQITLMPSAHPEHLSVARVPQYLVKVDILHSVFRAWWRLFSARLMAIWLRVCCSLP